MSTTFKCLAAGVFCMLGTATAAMAAAPAAAITDVNLRAGPSTHFPVLRVVPTSARIVTFGCLPDYSWCDVGFNGTRGWLAARYIFLAGPRVVLTPAVAAPLGIQVVAFNRAYWRAHYAAYPWAGRWPAYAARWRASGAARFRGPGRRGFARRGYASDCLSAGCSGSRNFTGPGGRSAKRSFSITP